MSSILPASSNKILVADDHAIIRTGLIWMIRRVDQTATFEDASSSEEIYRKTETNVYDLIILDISMRNLDSISLITNLLARNPTQRILIFTMSPENIFANRYKKIGAYGYLSKDASVEEIHKSIHQILINRKPYISDRLIESYLTGKQEKTPRNPFEYLSDRETEVMRHLLEGKSVSEISNQLKLHTSTIGTHKARIFEKLKVGNVIELNRLAEVCHLDLPKTEGVA